MSDYRRYFVPGGTYFFTVKTQDNLPIFTDPRNASLLGNVMRDARSRWPFEICAIVLLHDHWHALVSLPPNDDRYSARIGWIKKEFTKRYLAGGGWQRPMSKAKLRDRRKGVWQRRFWEHSIRDDDDFENHFHYIHWNPVKHHYVNCVQEWLYSSFHRWVAAGVYQREWGCQERPLSVINISDAGE